MTDPATGKPIDGGCAKHSSHGLAKAVRQNRRLVGLPPQECQHRAECPTECECFWLPEDQWLSAASCGYGSGYEPGSQMEWNPDCPVHRPVETTPLTEDAPTLGGDA